MTDGTNGRRKLPVTRWMIRMHLPLLAAVLISIAVAPDLRTPLIGAAIFLLGFATGTRALAVALADDLHLLLRYVRRVGAINSRIVNRARSSSREQAAYVPEVRGREEDRRA